MLDRIVVAFCHYTFSTYTIFSKFRSVPFPQDAMMAPFLPDAMIIIIIFLKFLISISVLNVTSFLPDI